MIIVQLKGGLGNQLFQYAAGFSLAAHHKVPLKVDIQQLKTPDELIGTTRNYELQHLIHQPEIATDEEIQKLTGQGLFKKYFQKLLPSYKRTVYNEKQLSFDKHFFEAGNHIYLRGYRQSEQYFEPVKEQIRKQFQFKPEIISRVEELAKQLQNTNSVSVHIRQGDYTQKAVKEYHGILPATYYQQAIDRISSLANNPSFFIFSDNMEWVKSNLRFPQQAEFISGNFTKTSHEDFYLMSRCKHNIIANSTFGWWAAWLNVHPNKIVIAPMKWYNKPELDTTGLIPAAWLRL